MILRPEVSITGRPERIFSYLGRFTNTKRWDSFEARPDDVFICTPPKCGTTWTQAICAFLILGTNDLYANLADISPWIDSELDPLAECIERIEAQKHRRMIKSHTPLDGIPYFDASTYLTVYRNPIDAFFSWRSQGLNMQRILDIPQYDPDPRKGFLAWVSEPWVPGAGESRSLEAYIYHYYSFYAYRHLDQIHFLHFADLKRDLAGSVSRIAKLLNITVPDARVAQICNLASFRSMKAKASAFAPASGKSVLKSDNAFFNAGTNNQGAEILTQNDLHIYRSKLARLLNDDEINWLEKGGKLPRDG